MTQGHFRGAAGAGLPGGGCEQQAGVASSRGAARRGLRAGRGLSWGGGCAPGFQKTQTRIIAQRPPGRAGGERGPQGQPGGDTEARGAGDPEARRRERRGADSVALTGRGGQRAPLLLPPHVVGVQPRSPAGRGRPARRAGPSEHRRLPVPAAHVAGGGQKRLSRPRCPPRSVGCTSAGCISAGCGPFACSPPVLSGASEVEVTFWLPP